MHTFADVRAEPSDDDEDPNQFKSRLQVIASDITAREMLILPRQAKDKLGIDAKAAPAKPSRPVSAPT